MIRQVIGRAWQAVRKFVVTRMSWLDIGCRV